MKTNYEHFCEKLLLLTYEVVTWCYGQILEQLSPSEYDEKYKTWNMSDLPIIPNP